MDLIQMTREMGRAMQSDERFIQMQIAKQGCDEDQLLQEKIREFNLKQAKINLEAQKEPRDEALLKQLNTEFRHLYGDILKNEQMTRYNEAREAFNEIFQEITGLLTLFADGQDPMTAVYTPPGGCDGSGCSGCSGC